MACAAVGRMWAARGLRLGMAATVGGAGTLYFTRPRGFSFCEQAKDGVGSPAAESKPRLARVSYTSTMRGDAQSAGSLVEGIAEISVKRNHQVGVSGHMCYDAKVQKVWQVLEGEEAVVKGIWERILQDRRHVIDEDTVELCPIESRRYPVGWGLRFSRFSSVGTDVRTTDEDDASKSAIMQLAYKSFIADQENGEKEVMETILPKAMIKNAKDGITGWMLYNDRNCTVYQVLEGPPESVERLWGKISRDPRHTICKDSIMRRAVKNREFPNWSMAANEVAQSSWAAQSY